MENKPTPGPWTLRETTSGGAIVTRGETQSTQIVPMADARLIAAAPDLLAALKALMEGVDDYWQTTDEGSAAMQAAKTAISKADGK